MDLSRVRAAKDPRTTAELVKVALEEHDAEAAAAARQVLRARGDREVLEAGLRLARSAAWEERRAAAEILGQLGWDDRTFMDESVDALLRLADDDRHDVVIATLFALGHRASPRGLEPLLARVNAPDEQVRLAVAVALPSVSADPRAVAGLIKLMRDPDEDVRDWATFGLGTQREEVDGPDVRAALLERAADEHDETRHEAMMGLALRGDPNALALVRAELGRPNPTALVAEAAETIADPSLVVPLRAALAQVENDPEAEPYWVHCFQDALAACERRDRDA